MSELFVIHPDWDEISKISHILSGRDFTIRKFENGNAALEATEKQSPDICMMPPDLATDTGESFVKTFKEKVNDCQLILLIDKSSITDAIAMVNENDVYDYFLLQPIIDPARLHIMIDKALKESAVQLNLTALKLRLASLPDNLPNSLVAYTHSLSGEIARVLENFKERVKGHEFKQILKLVDEEAFEKKIEELHKKDISEAIVKSEEKVKRDISTKLTTVAENVKKQIENPPDVNALQEIRQNLQSGFYFEGNELLSEKITETTNLKTSTNINKITEGISGQSAKILILQDVEYPTPELTSLVKDLGHEALTPASARRFINIVRFENIDCIILGMNTGDVNGVDGISLMQEVKEKLGFEQIPSILMMPEPTPEITKRALQTGITEIVKIPLDRNILQGKIRNCLSNKAAHPAAK